MYNSLRAIIDRFLCRIVKPEILENTNLYDIDVTVNDNLLDSNNIDVGYTTKDALRPLKGVTKLEILQFKDQCGNLMKSAACDELFELFACSNLIRTQKNIRIYSTSSK